jgi:hypothetical protein
MVDVKMTQIFNTEFEREQTTLKEHRSQSMIRIGKCYTRLECESDDQIGDHDIGANNWKGNIGLVTD